MTRPSAIPTTSSATQLILGVDAGGTKTAAWLAETGDNGVPVVVGRGRSSSGNPLSVGLAAATRAIAEAAEHACAEASRTGITRAVLSVAGSTDREMTRALVDWAHRFKLADEVAICSDFLPVLAAGTPNGYGIALISGTGSVAYARTADDRAARFGGWGYLLGDDGSGYAIGRAALRLALEGLESAIHFPPEGGCGEVSPGREEQGGDVDSGAKPLRKTARDNNAEDVVGERDLSPPGSFTGAILSKLRVHTVPELAQRIYSDPTPRVAIASLAATVASAAERGDASARTILDQGASDLAELVARAASVMGMATSNISLAIAGGVLVGSPHLRTSLARELARRNLQCEIRVVAEPLEGCLRLASLELADLGLEWH